MGVSKLDVLQGIRQTKPHNLLPFFKIMKSKNNPMMDLKTFNIYIKTLEVSSHLGVPSHFMSLYHKPSNFRLLSLKKKKL